MSVSIAYKPVVEKEYIEGAGSSFYKALEETFGNFPIHLTYDEHKEIVYAMMRAIGTENNPYEQLAIALDNHGEVLVIAEW